MKRSASLFLLVIGIIVLFLYKKFFGSVKEGFAILGECKTCSVQGITQCCSLNNVWSTCGSAGIGLTISPITSYNYCTCSAEKTTGIPCGRLLYIKGICPINTYGTYGTNGESCIPCPANAICTSGTTFTCKVGSYSNGNACTACPTGKTSPEGSTSINQCVCPANTYGPNCTACPTANVQTCPSGSGFTCAAGYSNTGTACEPCSPGWICSGTDNTQCGINTANPNSNSSQISACVACGSGFYSAAGASNCTACTPNTVSCTSNSFTCQSNYFSNAGACQPCPPNSTCAPGGSQQTVTGLTTLQCEQTRGWSLTTDGAGCERTKFATKMPYYTQGTADQINNTMPYYKNQAKTENNTVGCDTTDPYTCFYNWKTGPGTSIIGPVSSNPCPARNSWYDFAKEKCVDGLGNEVPINTMNPCGSNTVYSLRDNACVQVRVPFAQQPPNTIGLPSLTDPGDFSNCQTVDRGDCTPYYSNANGTFTTINPCPPGSPYNFVTRSCSVNPLIATSNACCGRPASELYTDATCSNYVNKTITYTKNTDLCQPGSGVLCCLSSRRELNECSNYWTRTSNYNYKTTYNALCGIAGFEDYDNSIDTMASKRLQWLQRRQLINA